MKTLQNNFTTPEQSKRLIELGVPAESADCYHTQEEIEGNMYWFDLHIKREYKPHTSLHASTIYGKVLPCWSVCRLMEIFDICAINIGGNTDEWPRTDSVKEELHLKYIGYIVQTFELFKEKLDFSKLEE